MRCMERNKVDFWYAPYEGHTHKVDEYGNELNETEVSYGNPVQCKGNVSAARGETLSRLFGEAEGYDKVIVLDDPDSPITEYDVLWVDSTPVVTGEGSLATDENTGKVLTPWDYIVKKCARSLNSVSIAITKVSVQ